VSTVYSPGDLISKRTLTCYKRYRRKLHAAFDVTKRVNVWKKARKLHGYHNIGDEKIAWRLIKGFGDIKHSDFFTTSLTLSVTLQVTQCLWRRHFLSVRKLHCVCYTFETIKITHCFLANYDCVALLIKTCLISKSYFVWCSIQYNPTKTQQSCIIRSCWTIERWPC